MIDQHYLQLLSQSYPTAADVRSHIIRLRAILSLPKGTEYFFSDLASFTTHWIRFFP